MHIYVSNIVIILVILSIYIYIYIYIDPVIALSYLHLSDKLCCPTYLPSQVVNHYICYIYITTIIMNNIERYLIIIIIITTGLVLLKDCHYFK